MQPQTLGLAPSFGFGDRLGLATPGHVESMRRAGGNIKGIFPQQSIREMTRTQRTADGVMRDAVNALEAERWTDLFGADADHLKTPADIAVTAAAGFTFFTLDPSAEVDPKADSDDDAMLRSKLAQTGVPWLDAYRGRSIKLANGTTIELTE
ncbi:MAG TPA: tagaturonate epimerase family protein, partial [Caulifigura sp.]|nr:tagaturonate epimerase family protein [Caulifigura sp.]